MQFFKTHTKLVLGVILGAFFVVSLIVSHLESTTMDEKAHIPAGYSYVRYGDMRINPEHGPILKDLAGLPLLLLQPQPYFPLSDPLWEEGDELNRANHPEGAVRTWGLAQWTFGDKILHQNGNDADAITFWSRVPIILVALLLGYFIFRWTRELAGPVAGLFAVTLYAFDPNIIAHSHYVTTDIGIAAFIFIAAYYFVHFLKNPSWKNILLMGISLGVVQAVKFSAVLLFPTFGLFVLAYAFFFPLSGEGRGERFRNRIAKLWEYSWKFALGVAICFLVIILFYIPNVWNMPASVTQEIARVQFPNTTAIGRFAENTVVGMAEVPGLKGLAHYFLGLFMVFARVAGGNTYYFLGTVSNHASPWYFPVVFLLKETLPFLFLVVFTSAYSLYRMGKAFVAERKDGVWKFLSDSFQNKIVQYLGVFFILFYWYVSITGNLNIGVRHLFPILPFMYMLVAKALFDFLKRHDHHGERISHTTLSFFLGSFIFAIVAIPVLAFPHYLSYFNIIGGGHTQGYKYVTDSNYDWGQDVKRLRNFVVAHNRCVSGTAFPSDNCVPTKNYPAIDTIRVDYFGGSSPQYYLGEKYMGWHGEHEPEAGWYAISVGFFQESSHKQVEPGQWSYRWLNDMGMKPVARAGDSILIFYVPEVVK